MDDGIYFAMPEAEYLALPRLSKSGIKKLRISAADFWASSWLNPNQRVMTPEQERKRQMAMVIGRAYHCARLEPERFAAEYVRELSQSDFAGVEGFLTTGEEMGEALERMGLKKAGKVFDQAQRLVVNGYPAPVWHYELEQWREGLADGQTIMPAATYDEIVADMHTMRLVPEVDDLLSGGFAEVTVLWTCPDTGIPMKSRFDYMKAKAWGEVKTFANKNGKSLNQALLDAVKFNRYYIDAAVYLDAAEMIRGGTLPRHGWPFGDPKEEACAMLDEIVARSQPLDCHFVFQQTGGVPNILERKFELFAPSHSEDAIAALGADGATGERMERAEAFRARSMTQPARTAIHIKARLEIAAAKREFLRYSEIYEPGEPWRPWNPSGSITDDDFSSHFLEDLT